MKLATVCERDDPSDVTRAVVEESAGVWAALDDPRCANRASPLMGDLTLVLEDLSETATSSIASCCSEKEPTASGRHRERSEGSLLWREEEILRCAQDDSHPEAESRRNDADRTGIGYALTTWRRQAEELLFLPPVLTPRTFRDFYAFEEHVATCRARRGLPMEPVWYEQPVFYFSNPLSLVGQGAPVHAPVGSQELDYELELGLIIGRGGKDIRAEEAWDHVAGFTIINDFSARDLQRREMAAGLGPAKGKDFATAVGPWLVTLDELRDRIDERGRLHLAMAARVNGRELSRGNSASMYFTWPRIIEHASRDAVLAPGDLLGSGTVGTGCILELGPERTGGWLKPGDVVELEIERLGVLRTPIAARPDRADAETR